MKFFLTWSILILILSTNTFAKNATMHFTLKKFSGRISVYDPELRYDLTKNKMAPIQLDAHQSASYTIAINKPTYLILYFESDRFFNWSLFLSPGDDLFLTADFSKKNNNVVVTGKGNNNNQPQIFALTNMDTQQFKGDTTPNRVIAAINKQSLLNKAILANYIRTNKPSTEFVKSALINIEYFVPVTYYEFSHNNNFGRPNQQLRKWQKVQDSVFSTIRLSNNNALIGYNYTELVDNFIMREMGDAWMEFRSNPTLFYKQWFNSSMPQDEKLFNSAQAGILIKKIINKYFTGNAAEYAYCQSLKFILHKADYQSAIVIFDRFKEKYPTSEYIKRFSAPMAVVVNKQQQTLSGKIIFITDDSIRLNTFKDVLGLNKGKVVFIDMWGTWCGPCRVEIEKNAKKLRDHFKGKNVTFLYIANLDVGREKEWKKQIAYFQMEGEHILANPKLTADIMAKVKGIGYPTYIIVKKDGSYRQTVTKYPVNITAIIKEIEAAGS